MYNMNNIDTPKVEENEPTNSFMDDHEIMEWVNKVIPEAADAWEAQFSQSKEDLVFLAKEHWPSSVIAARGNTKPAPIYDLTTPFVNRITSDVRDNPPGVIVRRSDNADDQYLAEYLQGYIRHVESTINAKMLYEQTNRNQVACGLSWLIPGYDMMDDFSFQHTLTLEVPEDPTSVMLDIDSSSVDGNDAQWGCHLKELSDYSAEVKYGIKKDELNTTLAINKLKKFWLKNKGIVIARVWRKVEVDDVLVLLFNPLTNEKTGQWQSYIMEHPELFQGMQPLKQRDAKRPHIYHYIVAGDRVIHKQEWPGIYLPIIPVYGEVNWHTKGKIYEGVVRKIMDPQRAYNYYKGAETEFVALAPRAPYIIPVGAIDGFEPDWDTINSSPKPYEYYHPYDNQGRPINPPSRDQMSVDPSGLINAAQAIQATMGAIIGNFDSPVGASGIETSGKAILAKQKASDRQNSTYYSNLSHSVARLGKVWVDLALALVQDDTDLTTEDVDGKKGSVKIGRVEVKDQATGKIAVYDANKGKYDVTISTGPSYASKLDESSQASLELMGVLPDAQRAAIAPFVVGMQSWPDAERGVKILVSSLPPEIQDAYKTEEEGDVEIPEVAQQMMDQMSTELQTSQQESTLLTQQIQELTKMVTDLNAQINSNIQAAQIKTESDERQNLVDNQTKIELKQMELGIDQENMIIEKAAERALEMMRQSGETTRKRMESASKVQSEAVRAIASPQTDINQMQPLDRVGIL